VELGSETYLVKTFLIRAKHTSSGIDGTMFDNNEVFRCFYLLDFAPLKLLFACIFFS